MTYQAEKDPSLTRFEQNFYAHALRQAREGPASTGYGNPVNQRVRFIEFVSSMAKCKEHMTEMSILDVGCGTGDLFAMLLDGSQGPKRYMGVDRDPRMIEAAKDRFKEEMEVVYPPGDVDFFVGDGYSLYDTLGEENEFDIVACIATLAMKPEDWDMTQALRYVQDQIDRMAGYATKFLFVTLFSTWKNHSIPSEMNLNPATMFDWAMSKYGRVDLAHGYAPHDFSLTIWRDEGEWWAKH